MFYLMALGTLVGFGLSGNFLTLFLFFEAVTLCSVPLVLHSMKKEAVAAAFKYLYYSIAGASLALIGFFFINKYAVTMDFTPGGVIDPQMIAGNEGSLLAAVMLMIAGFGAKAGIFPLHAWLPAAHPAAPAPASAILSGIITKTGVFAVIRCVFYLTGPDIIRGTWVQTVWITIALFSAFMGSVLAFREREIKRMLAYSSVSQVSFIMFGIATLTPLGFIGALLHMVFHSIAKDALFLTAGAIAQKTGKTDADLRGAGRRMPATMWCFTLLAATLIGLPPASGFVSKWYLASGSLASGTGVYDWLGPAVLLLSALLSAGYLLPVAVPAFFPGAGHEDNYRPDASEPRLSMLAPVILLTAAAIAFGIFPGALINLFEGIAQTIM